MSRFVVTLFAALAVAAPASAATGWTTQPVSGAGAMPPDALAFTAGGTGLLTYEAIRNASQRKFTDLVLRRPDGTWQAPAELPGVTWGLARVRPAGSKIAMVGMRAYAFGRYHRAKWQVVTTVGNRQGRFGKVRYLQRDVQWVGSASGHGEVLAAWTMKDSGRLRVAHVLPHATHARTLTPYAVSRVVIAIGPRGHVLAAWLGPKGVEARMRIPGGHWGPIRAVDAPRLYPDDLRAAVSAGGRAVISWGAAAVQEDRPGRADVVVARTGPRGRWRATRLTYWKRVDPLPVAPAADVVFEGSRPVVAYSGLTASGPQIVVSSASGKVRARFDAPSESRLEDLAVSPTGELAVVWSALSSQSAGPGPFVATTPRDGPFTAPVDLRTAESSPL